MDKVEIYKQMIIKLIESSKDENYVKAVYSFAANYPDRSKKG